MTLWLILLIVGLGTALALITPLSTAGKKPILTLPLMAGILIFSFGLYSVLGTPTPPPPAALETPDINAMVEGLAERLEANPDDPQGWARLIRSRIVMGDTEALIRDHKAMSAYFADQPAIITEINQRSGFDELAASLEEE
ncbi:hypothetical protein [Litorimonas sp.]|uniref:hypothetical protein n=1 Tax=Litorimonas sp. TaxID=1892381 RepID=UPI003A8753AA